MNIVGVSRLGRCAASGHLAHWHFKEAQLSTDCSAQLKTSCAMQFGDMRGFWGIWHAGLSQLRKKTGVIPAGLGEGTANTALVYHANKLMSLHEGDLPYAVRCLPANVPHRWPRILLQEVERWGSCFIPAVSCA